MRFTEPFDAPEAKRRLDQLAGLDCVLSLEVGLDVLGTEASYHLALVTTHEDLAGLTAYQQHPSHEQFLEWVRPRLSARAVVDAEV